MKSIKRISAVLFALAMIVTMLPIFSMTASAAGSLSVSDANIGLSWTDASSSSGKASWTASGDTITGTATGYKTLGILNRTITTKLTIKNNYADTRKLSFSYSLSGGGSVSGISGNSYSGELAAGGTLVITLTSPGGTSTNTLTITGIKLIGNSNVTTTFQPVEGGSYTVDGVSITAETSYTKAPTESSYALKATPASGYSFFGWYNETAGSYMDYAASVNLTVGSDATIKPVFISGTPAHFTVGGGRFYDLSEAVAAAQSGTDKKIVVAKDGTVSGSHTIPSGITLLVPYDEANTTYGAATPSGLLAKRSPACTSSTGNQVDWVSPTRYRTLTLGADAHITLNGVLEVGGRHAAGGGTKGMYAGSPTGPLGFIEMQAGSHIDLNNGSYLYCWGYIYGDGTITAKSGSSIYENFQMQDFRGGDKSTQLAEDGLVFSNSQYYVQNIEVATTYEYGSTEYVLTSIYMSAMCHSATVQFIGSNAMFRPEPGSYVIKDYDPTTDNLYLDSYGDCALAELAMNLAGVDVKSGSFVLPITNNMQIRIKTGTATLKQNVMMLPGSSITVDQGATLNLAYTDKTTNVVTAGGYILQMFDYTNYTYGIDMDTFEVVTGRYYNHLDTRYGMRTRPVPFTCTDRKTRTEADLADAMLNINGTVISNGFIYSTVDYADILNEDYTITGGGANICSSEGTGVLEMVNGCGYDVFGVMYDQNCSTDGTYYYIPLASAQLKNGDGTLVDTTNAEPGTVYEYCAEHDCWYTGECDQHDPCAAGHSYESEQTKAPSCTVAGEMTYTCSVCGDSYTEAITATGHTAGAAADCDSAQTCTVCGVELAPALGHTAGAAADCENAQTCTVCGVELAPALGHTAGAEADCDSAQTCTVCGVELNAALGHSYVGEQTQAPTCGDVGEMTYTCSACGDSYTEEIAATGEHSYFYPCDKVCMVCYQETNPDATHNIVAVEAVEATCTVNGNIAYWYCSDCGSVWADEALTQVTNRFSVILPAIGEHSYDHEFDADCNVCGGVREVDRPIVEAGKSISEDVSGLAFRFNVAVSGMEVNKTTAIYDNATIGDYKLISMGAIVSNGNSELDIPCVYLMALEDDSADFAVRVIKIPDTNYDSVITAIPYFVVEIDGVETTIYGESVSSSYNAVANVAMN